MSASPDIKKELNLTDTGHDGTPLPAGVKGPVKQPFKLYPFQWIYRVNFFGFHPFPWFVMVALLIGTLPMILYASGVPVPQMSDMPILGDIFKWLGWHNDRDLFVNATWVIWWPAFILTMIIFRRIWCGGFCPFGLLTDVGNWVGKKLRRGKEAKPISVTKFVFMAFITFLVIGYLHDAVNITNSVIMSVEFVIFFMVFAFIVGVMLPRRTFCRSFCFVGALPHLFGRLAFLGLKTDRNKCKDCKGQWCVSSTRTEPKNVTHLRKPLINSDGCPMFINVPQLGHAESNRHCILCGNCIKNCPYDAIHYKYLPPGYEILKGTQLNGYETFFTLGIIAVLAMFVALEGGLLGTWGTWINTFFEFPNTKFHWFYAGSFAVVAVIVLFALYFFVTAISAAILRINVKRALVYFGYAYLPFCYLMFFRDILVVYFVDGSFVQVWLGQGPQWFMAIIPATEIFLIVISVAWSMFLTYRLAELVWVHENPEKQVEWEDALAGAVPHFLLIAFMAWFWLDLLFPHLSERFTVVGISPWVPVAVPIIVVILFAIAYWGKIIKPLSWELENE
ncbi:MAG: 4Fe-4S binding protein [Candidatus Woesearchaeota archaeon]|nr:4Fe-4S binding protein [Candidatus Woesearchaeota archaeon]